MYLEQELSEGEYDLDLCEVSHARITASSSASVVLCRGRHTVGVKKDHLLLGPASQRRPLPVGVLRLM